MSALAYAQHMYETPDHDFEADDRDSFLSAFEPTDKDYALAFDNASDLLGFMDALSADMTVAQAEIVDSEDLLDRAYNLAYAIGGDRKAGSANQVRLSTLLGIACERAGIKTYPFIRAQLDMLAERDWQNAKNDSEFA